jgi:hypothetical protein
MHKTNESIETVLPAAQQALARNDISMRWEVDELLKLFPINLDPTSAAYRELGMEVLRSFVKAPQAVERRQKGEVVDTPRQPDPLGTVAPSDLGGSLSAACPIRQPWSHFRSHLIIQRRGPHFLLAAQAAFARQPN